MQLLDLMSCTRFEFINAFLQVFTVHEEVQNAGDALKKVRPLHDHVKKASLEYYQPLRELSVEVDLGSTYPRNPRNGGLNIG